MVCSDIRWMMIGRERLMEVPTGEQIIVMCGVLCLMMGMWPWVMWLRRRQLLLI